MKLQTSIEWMIIIASIGALCLVSLSIYSKFSSNQKAISYSLINKSLENAADAINQSTTAGSNLSFYYLIPPISYINQSNDVEVMLSSSENFTIIRANVSADNSIVLPTNYSDITSPGFSELAFSVMPVSAGPIMLSINVTIEFRGSFMYEHANSETYAIKTQPLQTTFVQQYASILRHNESLSFSILPWNSTYTISQWDHCSYLGFYGGELGIGAQCGSGANWYYWTFSDYCYSGGITEMTHCVYLNPTDTEIGKVSLSYNPIYNITVEVYNSTGIVYANLSNLAKTGVAYSGDNPIGIATVTGSVYGDSIQPYDQVIILNRSGNEYPINLTSYDAYSQALDNLFSVMDYYNKSSADDGIQNIDEAITAYQDALNNLNNTPVSGIQGCSLNLVNGTGNYVCKPFSTLTYSNITITLNGSRVNQQLNAGGSTIILR